MDRPGRKSLEIHALPSTDPSRRRSIAITVAKAIGRPLSDATTLLTSVPVRLPRAMDETEATRWMSELRAAGAEVSVVQADVEGPCATHEDFVAATRCSRCESPICSLCVAQAGGAAVCEACAKRSVRSRSFYLARVSFLLIVLAGVLFYAWRDHHRRTARNDWDHTLEVAVVIVRIGAVSQSAIDAMVARAPALADGLQDEMHRYRPGGVRPFRFTVLGPFDATDGPPGAPNDDGVVAAAKRSWTLSRYLSPIDARVGLRASQFDARVYVVVRPSTGQRNVVEGVSEQGGRVGLVQVELDGGMIDFALFVTAHEVFHTLGATDRYLPDGSIVVPDGLADPDQSPLYPQRQAELMARLRATSPTGGASPEKLSELRVGPLTAREVGWVH